jgi:hypothetical protein
MGILTQPPWYDFIPKYPMAVNWRIGLGGNPRQLWDSGRSSCHFTDMIGPTLKDAPGWYLLFGGKADMACSSANDIQETTRPQSRSCYSQYLQGGKSRL